MYSTFRVMWDFFSFIFIKNNFYHEVVSGQTSQCEFLVISNHPSSSRFVLVRMPSASVYNLPYCVSRERCTWWSHRSVVSVASKTPVYCWTSPSALLRCPAVRELQQTCTRWLTRKIRFAYCCRPRPAEPYVFKWSKMFTAFFMRPFWKRFIIRTTRRYWLIFQS